MLSEPDLLVLDEPVGGLDYQARLLLKEVVDQQRCGGKSVLIVSDALGEVAPLCDRVAVLVEGRLACLDSVASLLRDPDTDEPRSFESAIGSVYGSCGGMP